MVLRFLVEFVKRIVAEIKYQLVYYTLGGAAQLEDFIHAKCNRTDLIDKSGEIAVVTGGSRGIGLHVVRMLLQCNMHVIIGCRNTVAGESAIAALRASGVTQGTIECFKLDTASLASVRSFAKKVVSAHPIIHVLVNNAGIMFVPYSLTEDGIESHQAVNYIGHFVLTQELLPSLEKAGHQSPNKSRIVNVTSCAYAAGTINYSDFNNTEGYIASAAYAQSKLAQLVSTVHMSRLFTENNIPVNVYAVHPGIVNTELFDGTAFKKIFPWVPKLLFKSPEKGAMPIVHAAISPLIENRSGIYISNCRETPVKKHILNPSEGYKLHKFTFDLIKIKAPKTVSS
ncbi:retinol dehydrogenase 12-like [Thrips palmi]|uniref:Retinol dehydrogenase 12-like n=1 Tax=Thrips palmi TaxID=161013 RepID=A0A6P8ZX09_THRPL|nr:retinol dehydrogenase 12-like [Thrips palmi]